MGLLKMIFWGALLVAATFGFTVLFEHGFTNYGENARLEWDGMMKFIHSKAEKPKT